MAGRRNRRHTRRRRGRFGGLYRLLAVLAVLAAVAAACVIFFRVNEVTVQGNARYTAQELIDASGIRTGDNLMAMSKGHIATAIRTKLPYVETVSIYRRLPDRVEIVVRERVAVASVESSGGRWLISSQGRLLEPLGDQDVVTVVGLEARSPFGGSQMQVAEEDANTLDHVIALLTALEGAELLPGCDTLDCTAATEVELKWEIYTIKFPRGGDYPAMLRMLSQALASEEMPQNEPGTFDFTVKEGELYFRRNK